MDINALKAKEDKIKELLQEHFETEIVSSIGLSSYLIFRDGTLVGAYRHRDMMDYLHEQGVLTTEEINQYDTAIFNEVFSCVRCSDYTNDENYIGITDEPLTEAQYRVLKDWIDNNVEINRKGVMVTAHFASENQDSVYYDYANIIKEGDWPSDYIIFKIKKYYSTGKLEEDIQPIEGNGTPNVHITSNGTDFYDLSRDTIDYICDHIDEMLPDLTKDRALHYGNGQWFYQVKCSDYPENDNTLLIGIRAFHDVPQKTVDYIVNNSVEYADWYKTNEDLQPEPATISTNAVWHIIAGKHENSRLCMDVYFIPDKLKANLWDIYVEEAVKERYGNNYNNINLLNMRWIYLGSNSFMIENRLQIIFGKGSNYGPLDIPDDDEKIIENTILSYGNIVDVDDEYWKDVLDNQIKGNPVYELILYEDLEPIMDTSNQVITGRRGSEDRITIDVSNMTDFKEYVAKELDLEHRLFNSRISYNSIMNDTEHYKWLYYTYPEQINNNYGFLNIRYYAGDDMGWVNVLGSNIFGFNPSQEWRNEIIRRTPEFADMLKEELRKSNIQELITLLEKKGVDISSFFNIAESSSHLKTATDEQKKAYEEARKELSNIQTKCAVIGFYKGEPDPGSYIVWGISLEEAKSLSCRLLQEDMIHTQISKKTDTLVATRYKNAQDHNFEGFDADPESGSLVLIADSPTGDFIERGCSGWPKEKFYFSYNLYKEYDSPTDTEKFRELSLNEDLDLRPFEIRIPDDIVLINAKQYDILEEYFRHDFGKYTPWDQRYNFSLINKRKNELTDGSGDYILGLEDTPITFTRTHTSDNAYSIWIPPQSVDCWNNNRRDWILDRDTTIDLYLVRMFKKNSNGTSYNNVSSAYVWINKETRDAIMALHEDIIPTAAELPYDPKYLIPSDVHWLGPNGPKEEIEKGLALEDEDAENGVCRWGIAANGRIIQRYATFEEAYDDFLKYKFPMDNDRGPDRVFVTCRDIPVLVRTRDNNGLQEDIDLQQNTAPNMLGFTVTPVDDSQISEELHGTTNLYILPDGTLGKVLPDDEPGWNTPETDEVLDYADANCVQMWGSTDTFATDMNMIFIHLPTADLTDAQKATLRRIKPILVQVRDESGCDFSIYSPNRNNNNFRHAEFTLSPVDEDLNLETPANVEYDRKYLLYFGYNEKTQEYIESIINAYAYDERWYLELLDSNTETQQSGLFAEFPDEHMNGKMTFGEAYQAFVNYDLGDTTDNLRLVYADPEDPNDPIDVLGKAARNIHEDIIPTKAKPILPDEARKYLLIGEGDLDGFSSFDEAIEYIDELADDPVWSVPVYSQFGDEEDNLGHGLTFEEAYDKFINYPLEPAEIDGHEYGKCNILIECSPLTTHPPYTYKQALDRWYNDEILDDECKEQHPLAEDIQPNEIPAESWEKYLYFDSMLDRDATVNNTGEVSQELIEKFRNDYCWFIKYYDGEEWREWSDTHTFEEALNIFMTEQIEPGDLIDVAFSASNLTDYTEDRLDLESWPGHTAYECDWISVLSRDHNFNEVNEDLQPKERGLPDYDKEYTYGRTIDDVENFINERFDCNCWAVRAVTSESRSFCEIYIIENTDFFSAYDIFENITSVDDERFQNRNISICIDYRPYADTQRYGTDECNEYGLLVKEISNNGGTVQEDFTLTPRETANLPRHWNELNLNQVKWLIDFLKDRRSKQYYSVYRPGTPYAWSIYRNDYFKAAGEYIESCLQDIESGDIKVCVDDSTHGYAVGRATGSPLHAVMLYKLKGDGTYKRWFPYHEIEIPEILIPGYLDEDLDLQSRKVDIDKYLYKPEAREYIDEFSHEPRWVVMGIEVPEGTTSVKNFVVLSGGNHVLFDEAFDAFDTADESKLAEIGFNKLVLMCNIPGTAHHFYRVLEKPLVKSEPVPVEEDLEPQAYNPPYDTKYLDDTTDDGWIADALEDPETRWNVVAHSIMDGAIYIATNSKDFYGCYGLFTSYNPPEYRDDIEYITLGGYNSHGFIRLKRNFRNEVNEDLTPIINEPYYDPAYLILDGKYKDYNIHNYPFVIDGVEYTGKELIDNFFTDCVWKVGSHHTTNLGTGGLWNKNGVNGGTDFEQAYDLFINFENWFRGRNDAYVSLILINNNYCYPVLARECNWEEPVIEDLTLEPADGKMIHYTQEIQDSRVIDDNRTAEWYTIYADDAKKLFAKHREQILNAHSFGGVEATDADILDGDWHYIVHFPHYEGSALANTNLDYSLVIGLYKGGIWVHDKDHTILDSIRELDYVDVQRKPDIREDIEPAAAQDVTIHTYYPADENENRPQPFDCYKLSEAVKNELFNRFSEVIYAAKVTLDDISDDDILDSMWYYFPRMFGGSLLITDSYYARGSIIVTHLLEQHPDLVDTIMNSPIINGNINEETIEGSIHEDFNTQAAVHHEYNPEYIYTDEVYAGENVGSMPTDDFIQYYADEPHWGVFAQGRTAYKGWHVIAGNLTFDEAYQVFKDHDLEANNDLYLDMTYYDASKEIQSFQAVLHRKVAGATCEDLQPQSTGFTLKSTMDPMGIREWFARQRAGDDFTIFCVDPEGNTFAVHSDYSLAALQDVNAPAFPEDELDELINFLLDECVTILPKGRANAQRNWVTVSRFDVFLPYYGERLTNAQLDTLYRDCDIIDRYDIKVANGGSHYEGDLGRFVRGSIELRNQRSRQMFRMPDIDFNNVDLDAPIEPINVDVDEDLEVAPEKEEHFDSEYLVSRDTYYEYTTSSCLYETIDEVVDCINTHEEEPVWSVVLYGTRNAAPRTLSSDITFAEAYDIFIHTDLDDDRNNIIKIWYGHHDDSMIVLERYFEKPEVDVDEDIKPIVNSIPGFSIEKVKEIGAEFNCAYGFGATNEEVMDYIAEYADEPHWDLSKWDSNMNFLGMDDCLIFDEAWTRLVEQSNRPIYFELRYSSDEEENIHSHDCIIVLDNRHLEVEEDLQPIESGGHYYNNDYALIKPDEAVEMHTGADSYSDHPIKMTPAEIINQYGDDSVWDVTVFTNQTSGTDIARKVTFDEAWDTFDRYVFTDDGRDSCVICIQDNPDHPRGSAWILFIKKRPFPANEDLELNQEDIPDWKNNRDVQPKYRADIFLKESDEEYAELCKIIDKSFDDYIVEPSALFDFWLYIDIDMCGNLGYNLVSSAASKYVWSMHIRPDLTIDDPEEKEYNDKVIEKGLAIDKLFGIDICQRYLDNREKFLHEDIQAKPATNNTDDENREIFHQFLDDNLSGVAGDVIEWNNMLFTGFDNVTLDTGFEFVNGEVLYLYLNDPEGDSCDRFWQALVDKDEQTLNELAPDLDVAKTRALKDMMYYVGSQWGMTQEDVDEWITKNRFPID